MKTAPKAQATPEAETDPDQEEPVSDEIPAAIRWLKGHMGPANEVQEKMSITAKQRSRWIKNTEEPKTVTAILQEYPRLVDQGMVRSWKDHLRKFYLGNT